MGRVLDNTVIHRRIVLGHPLPALAFAPAQLYEGDAELLRHEVVDDGVDGTVDVDAHATEEQVPGVVVRWIHEGVGHHQCSVGHPEQGEEDHHHSEHLGDL